jgi:mono/diheme cytochrome c family protein
MTSWLCLCLCGRILKKWLSIPFIRLQPIALVAMLAVGGSARAQDIAPGAVAAGREFASKTCANCHVVAEDQKSEPILKPSAPSFAQIAARSELTESSLRDFLANPHGEARRTSNMPSFAMSSRQISEIIAYIFSLRPQGAKTR